MPRPSVPTLPTMTRSPSSRPDRTSAIPVASSTTPICTGFWATVSPSMVYTYGLPSSLWRIDAPGTTRACVIVRPTIRPDTHVPLLSTPAGFATCASFDVASVGGKARDLAGAPVAGVPCRHRGGELERVRAHHGEELRAARDVLPRLDIATLEHSVRRRDHSRITRLRRCRAYL